VKIGGWQGETPKIAKSIRQFVNFFRLGGIEFESSARPLAFDFSIRSPNLVTNWSLGQCQARWKVGKISPHPTPDPTVNCHNLHSEGGVLAEKFSRAVTDRRMV